MSLELSPPDDAPDLELSAHDQSLLERIQTLETRAADASALDEVAGRLDKIETRLARPNARVEVKEDDAALERKAWNSFLRKGWEGIGDLERKVLSAGFGGSPSADGYALVPENFLREILKNLVLISPMRQVARVQNVSGGGPVLIPRRISTLSAAWVAELEEHATSEPTYDQVSVNLYEMRVTSEISNQLLEDAAFDMAAELARDLAEQFGYLEGLAFVSGSGTGQPEGFLTAASFVKISDTLDADAVIDLFHSVPTVYANNGTWLMNRQTMGQIRKFRSAVDGPYIWVDSIAPGTPPTLMGRPVLEMPAMSVPGVGSPAAVSIAFGDWAQAYRVLDRVNLEVLRDPYTRARNSIVAFHARRRVGGALIKAEAVRGMSA